MRKLVAIILAVLGSAVAVRAQQAVLDSLVGKDLWNGPSETDIRKLDGFLGVVVSDPLGQPRPWHVWKTTDDGQSRYVVLLGAPEWMIPGNSSACVAVFDGRGSRLRSWCFQTGWRGTLRSASLGYYKQTEHDLIVINMSRFINGRNIAKEYFALSHGRLRFIRMEDDRGMAVQNEYIYPNYEIGVVPEAKSVEEWLNLLGSSDPADVLSALMFLGGRHLAEPERRFVSEPKESKYAGLFQQLIGDPRIRAAVERLRQSDNQWVREAAGLAARGPRDRPLY